jgi:hypothetical protein
MSEDCDRRSLPLQPEVALKLRSIPVRSCAYVTLKGRDLTPSEHARFQFQLLPILHSPLSTISATYLTGVRTSFSMPDLRALAQSCPPAAIADDLLAIINAQLRSFLTAPDPKETADDVLQYVAIGLNIHASRSLQNLGTLPPVRVDLLPLEALVKLVDLAPDALDDVSRPSSWMPSWPILPMSLRLGN